MGKDVGHGLQSRAGCPHTEPAPTGPDASRLCTCSGRMFRSRVCTLFGFTPNCSPNQLYQFTFLMREDSHCYIFSSVVEVFSLETFLLAGWFQNGISSFHGTFL